VAIKQRCLFCNEPLPWDKRADAIYCSPRCRQAAHHALHVDPEPVEWTPVTSPPLDYYPDDMDLRRVTWSSATPCDSCHRFIKAGFEWLIYGSIHGPFGCSWKCLRALTDDGELKADF
jgi:hypothetical protein